MPGKQDDLFDYDAELRRYHQHLRAAIGVRPADRVLDVGCGTGQTTREAARAAASGSALGADISAARLARARRLARAEGLRNISFVQADAQTHRFPPGRFDLAISRFGTMFFADPVAAFTNIGRALRPGARLVQLVWQHRDRQEWDAVIGEVVAGEQPPPAPAADPFSLADPDTAGTILAAAGFTAVDIMGRNKFGPQHGPWHDHDWRGWWGDEPPFHTPVFVLTHHTRPSFTLGDTTFHFADADPAPVLDRARDAAHGKDVRLGGGATTIRQFLGAGLVDTMHVAVSQVELGSGSQLWESPDELLDQFHLDAVPSPSGVTHHLFWRR